MNCLKKIILVPCLIATVFSFSQNRTSENKIGFWLEDEAGLPCFNYVGNLPFKCKTPSGLDVKIPEDPYFLLGNYRLTLFSHVSGEYELITGQRDWGRLNQGDDPNSGLNSSSIDVLNSNHETITGYQLTGMNSVATDASKCKRIFGTGFAKYQYSLDKISCSRVISVNPSSTPYNGLSAFLLTVKIKNNSSKTINLVYNESVTANYETMQQHGLETKDKKVKYVNTVSYDPNLNILKADIIGSSDDPLQFPTKESNSLYDGYPPSLFFKALSKTTVLKEIDEGTRNKFTSQTTLSLLPNEEKKLEFIVGYAFENSFSDIDKICQGMQEINPFLVNKVSKDKFISEAAFTNDWFKILPKLVNETDKTLKQEMIWHAYTLEAMATYNDFYKEVIIPQGTLYDYDWGIRASARDNFQHALPLIYSNPALAKSVLKYMMKRIAPNGEVKLEEGGYGFSSSRCYFTSDQQLYFFLLISEYLRITKDYDFLLETSEYYPAHNMPKVTGIDVIEKTFTYLRDEVGVGSHGLIKLLNSDWSDAVYYIKNVQYNRVLFLGESHMNSAMAISIMANLIPILENVKTLPEFSTSEKQLNNLSKSMTMFRTGVLNAFMKDLGDRTFPRRMYFNRKAYGEENMFLEPQGFTLQIPELAVERKRTLYEEMKKRVYKGEKLGARQQQTPEFDDPAFDYGSREDGGFWYALNGPVICGVAEFDKPEALKLLKMMSFDNFAKCYPNYWSSYWSASDNIESCLIPTEGLADQTTFHWTFPVFCAHPHAWLLYCYYKIKE